MYVGSPGGSVVKNLPANPGDADPTPELGRASGEENGNPLQYLAWAIPCAVPGRLQSMGL